MTTRRMISAAVLLAGLTVAIVVSIFWQNHDEFSVAEPLDRKEVIQRTGGAPAQLGRQTGISRDSGDAAAPTAEDTINLPKAGAPAANQALKRNEPLTVGGKADESMIRLSGVVMDAHMKAPLEAALVRIAPVRESASAMEMKSRQDGTFSLAVQRAPRYEVRAAAEGYRGYSQTGLVADSSRSDLVLELSPHWEISGIVLDERSHPVDGAAVWVRTASQTTRQAKAFSWSDRSGRFVVEGWIGAGSYLVGASHHGFLSQEPVRLEVPSQLEATLHLRSAPPEERGSIVGQVTDSQGLPVASAQLSLVNSEDFMTLQTALTGADGLYEMSDIRSGAYTVACRAEGFSGGAAGNFKGVQLSPGQRQQVDFRLERPSALDGIVKDEEGLPIVRAIVKLSVDQGAGKASFSDPQGRFSFEDIPPGRHTIRLTHRDFVTHEEALSFPSKGEYKVIMNRGVSLRGALRDLSGAPILEFKLSLIPEGADRPLKSARFDSRQGDFVLSGLLPGRYRLEFALPQSDVRRAQIDLQESRHVLVLIDLADASAPPRILGESTG